MTTLYSSLKFLRFSDHLEALQTGRVVAPVHIRIKPTNRCNHSCWYCAYRTDAVDLGEDMIEADRIPEAKMMEIVDDIIAMDVKAVTFSGGGEPLIYRPLPTVIDRLGDHGVGVAALTNGVNLQGRMAEALARHGTWVRVSLDAWDDDSYQVARNAKPGDFEKMMGNIGTFIASGTKCVLGVSFVVGHNNHDHIYDICHRMKGLGVNHVKVSGVVVGNEPEFNNIYHATIKDGVAEQIGRAKTLEDGGFQVLNHYHDLSERFDKRYTLCPFLQFLTVIGADQKVYTCQDKAYTASGILGSIKDRRFRDFWFSEENRRKLYAFDPSRLCRHHCVTHPKNLAIHEFLSIDRDHGNFV